MISEWQRALASVQIIPLYLPRLSTCRISCDVSLDIGLNPNASNRDDLARLIIFVRC